MPPLTCCAVPLSGMMDMPQLLIRCEKHPLAAKNRLSYSEKPKISNWDQVRSFPPLLQPESKAGLVPAASSKKPNKNESLLGNALKTFLQNTLALLASGWARLGGL